MASPLTFPRSSRSPLHLPDPGRARTRGTDHRLADQCVPIGAPVPSDRVPHDGPDRHHGHRHRHGSPCPHRLRPQRCAGRGQLLHRRARTRARRDPDPHRRPVERRMERARVVTGTNLFARSIGSAIGVAVFGAIANAVYAGTPHGDTDPQTVVAASSAVFLAVLIVPYSPSSPSSACPPRNPSSRSTPPRESNPEPDELVKGLAGPVAGRAGHRVAARQPPSLPLPVPDRPEAE